MDNKKYNEALEQAKKELAACGSMDCDAARLIFRLFPQLRESEDEKIRKWLITQLETNYKGNYWANKAIEYLEKQKESLHISETCKENAEYFTSQCGDNRFEIIDKAKRDIIAKTNIESSPDEMKVLDSFLFRAWQMGWLGKYDVIVPKQKPAEWSEEDESCWNLIWDILDGPFTASKEGHKKAAAWFLKNCPKGTKSLRPSWKPSEEQMDALNKARRFIPYNCDILESLYEQLKKL